MTKVKFSGWNEGVRKIRFIALLNEEGGLSLKEAKNIKDQVIGGGETVIVDFKNDTLAEAVCSKSIDLGVVAELVI